MVRFLRKEDETANRDGWTNAGKLSLLPLCVILHPAIPSLTRNSAIDPNRYNSLNQYSPALRPSQEPLFPRHERHDLGNRMPLEVIV